MRRALTAITGIILLTASAASPSGHSRVRSAAPIEVAVFAGGCFWGVQAVFQHVTGVTNAVSGYAGGAKNTATYDQVTTDRTGHAEAVQVTFDPKQISYDQLLQIFFSVAHDPTELNRQGPDVGTQYRSAIFPADDTQARTAQAHIAQLNGARKSGAPVVTTIEPGKPFFAAEAYHQDYLVRHPDDPYIVINDLPKLAALRRAFPDRYRTTPVLVSKAQEQRPTFKAATDLLVIEAQVVDRDGRPVPGLAQPDFAVKIAGRPRTVNSVSFVQYTDGTEGLTQQRVAATGGPLASASPKPENGRIFLIAVDELSLRDQQILPMMQDARAFVDRLQPEDQVALYSFPMARTKIDFTRDHGVIKRALGPALSAYSAPESKFNLSPGEIIDLTAGDPEVLAQVEARACRRFDPNCKPEIISEAQMLAAYHEGLGNQSLAGLVSLMQAVGTVPGRKTVVLISGGLMTSDRVVGRPNVTQMATKAGREAARANVSLYIIHADDHMADGMSARQGTKTRAMSVRDTGRMASGLEFVAGGANGHLVNVSAGTAEYAYSRVLRETAGYYILGVTTEARDRDGREHLIDIAVTRRDADVRHRPVVVIK